MAEGFTEADLAEAYMMDKLVRWCKAEMERPGFNEEYRQWHIEKFGREPDDL